MSRASFRSSKKGTLVSCEPPSASRKGNSCQLRASFRFSKREVLPVASLLSLLEKGTLVCCEPPSASRKGNSCQSRASFCFSIRELLSVASLLLLLEKGSLACCEPPFASRIGNSCQSRTLIHKRIGRGMDPWIVNMALPYFPLVLIRVPSL